MNKRASSEQLGPIPGYCVVDVLGHSRYVGYVSEVLVAGTVMLRIAVPTGENEYEVIYQSPQSLYAIRPCTEELARLLAVKHALPEVDEWDLPPELREKIRNVERLEREGQLPPQYPKRQRSPWAGDDGFSDPDDLEDDDDDA